MKDLLCCCFSGNSFDPLEFSTNHTADPDLDSKLKEIKTTFMRTSVNAPPPMTKPATQSSVVREFIPLYKYSKGRYVHGGMNIEVVYTNP